MKYKVNKGFIVQKNKGKTTLFDPEQSVMYTLNETASVVFEQIKRGVEMNQIAEVMIKKFSVRKEKVEKDINDLIEELKKSDIISS